MARPFSVYRGRLSALGQASAPTSIVAPEIVDDDIIAALTYRGYRIESAGPKYRVIPEAPGIPEPVHEPVLHLPPALMPELHLPYEPASPYAKYIRFLPYLAILFQDRSVLDLGKVV